MKKMFNGEKAITLITLIITIIILLILAGVVFGALLGNNGLLSRAGESKDVWKLAEFKEEVQMQILDIKMKSVEESVKFTSGYSFKDYLFEHLELSMIEDEKYGDVIDNLDGTISLKREWMEAFIDEDFEVHVSGGTNFYVKVEYSTKEWTNKSITATITANKSIQPIGGWNKKNNRTYTKSYPSNITDNVPVTTLDGDVAIATVIMGP